MYILDLVESFFSFIEKFYFWTCSKNSKFQNKNDNNEIRRKTLDVKRKHCYFITLDSLFRFPFSALLTELCAQICTMYNAFKTRRKQKHNAYTIHHTQYRN